MRRRPSHQAGFTLIELMVVVILIGIFSGLIIAEMRGTFEDALLRATARKIISAAEFANSQAVALNQAEALLIEPEAKRLRVVSKQAAQTVEEQTLDDRIRIEVRNATSPSDDDAEESPEPRSRSPRQPERIEFFPDGTADGREITLRDRMGVELVLKLNPATARLRITENEVAR